MHRSAGTVAVLLKHEFHYKETTPFLLAKVVELTGGNSLESNIKLVLNNAALAARTACELAK